MGITMTKDELLQKPENKSLNNFILAGAIMCYVSSAITLIFALTNSGFPKNIILDAALVLALGLFIHIKKSLPASIVLLVYGILNVAVLILVYHRFGGWLILLAGALATYGTFKLNDVYKKSQSNAAQFYNIQE